ncbi:hypothetical protein [Parabacteroides goldsteinii]|uniref:hypothetical protein n=1 Tax=Parabacteroides goldsteinii TaxID=328812 RepID=UPI002675D65B|nr:hypothetical protein [Parabacteroides goldsteinii]
MIIKELEEKLEKLKELHQHFQDREAEYSKKLKRAHSFEKSEKYDDLKRVYSLLQERTVNLSFMVRNRYANQRIIAEVYSVQIKRDYQYRLQRKTKRAEELKTKHRYSPWFLQTSLEADYGVFVCDKCGQQFYHSPSGISLNGIKVYDCCCGYCTNTIIGRDWNETPYF